MKPTLQSVPTAAGPSPKHEISVAPAARSNAARLSDPTHRFHPPTEIRDTRPFVARSGALQRIRARHSRSY